MNINNVPPETAGYQCCQINNQGKQNEDPKTTGSGSLELVSLSAN